MFDFCSATLSSCKNGSELIWNEDDRSILLRTSVTDSCNVYFDKYAYPVITRVTTSDITTNSITLTVEVTEGESSIATYYYSNNDGESYEESESNTYTFSNLSNGTEYNFKVYAVDVNGKSSEVYSLQETTEDAIYIADYIKTEVYTGDGNGGLYLHDGVGTYTNANQETGDNSYRYAGANPNNYVCFGSDAEVCPADNLYRIIGIFDSQIKLIKSASMGTYVWNSISSNVWANSSLNNTVLNRTYLNGLGASWSDMIDNHDWQVGGVVWTTSNGAAYNAYTSEIVNNSTVFNGKVGLLYLSDYYYAASPEYWTYPGYSSNGVDYSLASNNNWLFLGAYEWTITRNSDSSFQTFHIASTGAISNTQVDHTFDVRPTFYLKTDVAITSGDGTSSNPYRLSYSG